MEASAMAEVLGEAKVVVGLNIGTELSGYAYAWTSSVDEICTFDDWLGERYIPAVKTLCAVYYEAGDATTARVKSWGFPARHDYERDVDAIKLRGQSGEVMPELGAYFEDFTRHLASDGARESPAAELEKGFTVIRVLTDFLREMGVFVRQKLSKSCWECFGVDFRMRDIQWCVAVPSNWDDHAKKLVKVCMERAGLIRSANSPGGSAHPVRIVSELEAASWYCLKRDVHHGLEIEAGDHILAAHICNEIAGIVVQQVVSGGKSSYRMNLEAATSIGVCGLVDEGFDKLMFAKIPCLGQYLQESSRDMRDTFNYALEKIKRAFFQNPNIGVTKIYLPFKLKELWKRFDEAHGNSPQSDYQWLQLTDAEIETIFEPFLAQIVAFIEDKLLRTPTVKAIFLVGELSGTPYLLARVELMKRALVKPPNPATVVCQGAVVLAIDQLLENGPASSRHGDGIAAESSSQGSSELLPAHGSTRPSVWSRSSSSGASEPAPMYKASDSLAEVVVKNYTSDKVLRRPPHSTNAIASGAVVLSLDQATTSASNGRVQLLEESPTSSSHGDITVGNSSQEFSQTLSPPGSTSVWSSSSSSVWSSSRPWGLPSRSSGGGSERAPVHESSDSFAEDVVKKYTWDQILHLTNGPTSRRLGSGGFGTVYLGRLENGREVAVKILDPASQQGIPAFLNEVNLLKRVNHVNLVSLLGYCEDEQQVLVYEFAEEGSLWDHLHGEKTRLNDWKQRLSIALQAACGLEYLHTLCSPRIIHRDIKSENILLTKSMVAKVGDFGLSRLGADEHDNSKIYVTTKVIGTRGYLDPEYHLTGQLRHSSDVYSFGIVLLEIVTGRKPIPNTTDPRSCISNWVKRIYGRGGSRGVNSVADSAFGGRFNPKAMKLVIKLAMACIESSGESRPEMPEVVGALRQAQALELPEKKSWIRFS